MSPLTLLLIGGFVTWLALSDQYEAVVNTARAAPTGGYVDIPIGRLIFGGIAVGAPLLWDIGEDAKRQYVGLIMLMLIVVNYRGLQAFARELTQLAGGK